MNISDNVNSPNVSSLIASSISKLNLNSVKKTNSNFNIETPIKKAVETKIPEEENSILPEEKQLRKIDVDDVKKYAQMMGEEISTEDINYGLMYGRSIIADYIA